MRTKSLRQIARWGGACALMIGPTLALAQSGQPPTGPPTTAPLVNDDVKDRGTKTAPPRVTTEVLPPVPATASDPAPPGTRAVRVDLPAADPGTVPATVPGAVRAPATVPAAAPAATIRRPTPGVQSVEGVVTKVMPPGKELAEERKRFLLDPSQDWESFVTRGPAGLPIRERDTTRIGSPEPVEVPDTARSQRPVRGADRVIRTETIEEPEPARVPRTELDPDRGVRTETIDEARRTETGTERAVRTETLEEDPAPTRVRQTEERTERVRRTEPDEKPAPAPAPRTEPVENRVLGTEPVEAGEAQGDADQSPGLEMVVTQKTYVYAFARSPDGHDLFGADSASTPDSTRDRRIAPAGPKLSNFTNIREGSFVAVRYRRTGDVYEVLNLSLIESPTLPTPTGTTPATPDTAAPGTRTPDAAAPIGTVPGAPAAVPGRFRVPTVPTTPAAPSVP